MTTYYVRPTNGSDGAAGTSFAAAWQTLQKAFDTATAGDDVRLCAEATETTAVTVDINTNSGSTTAPIAYYGASATTGEVDGSVYKIQASASITGGLIAYAASMDAYRFKNVHFDANSNADYCIYNNVDGADYHAFDGCTFSDATSDCLWLGGSWALPPWTFVGCDIYGAGGWGIRPRTNNRGYVRLYQTKVHDCVSGGIYMDMSQCQIVSSYFYDHDGVGMELRNIADGVLVFGNVIDGNGSDGLLISTTSEINTICGNTITNNGGYGINNTGGIRNHEWSARNFFWNNASGDEATAISVLVGTDNYSADPRYTSRTDGSEDYRPQYGSPVLGRLWNGAHVGVMPPVIRSPDHPMSGRIVSIP